MKLSVKLPLLFVLFSIIPLGRGRPEWIRRTFDQSPIGAAMVSLDYRFLRANEALCQVTGYSRGLKGEEIPLAARLFAVVDVWDALCSNRPYRARWPEEKVKAYLYEQAGRHFDPQVVEIFLREIV